MSKKYNKMSDNIAANQEKHLENLEKNNIDDEAVTIPGNTPASTPNSALLRQDQGKAAGGQNAGSVENTGGAGASQVYVFANLQSGQSFRLADGSSVTINGMPVSRLKGPEGQSFAGGKYGVSEVSAAKWAEVMQSYGNMKIFQNGLVFDAPSLERGKAMARERGGLRHGYEPVDPASLRVKTSPRSDD